MYITNRNYERAMLVLGVLILLLLIGAGPVLTILSINALFMLNIPISIWTWLAVVWLNLTTFGGLAATIRQQRK